MRPFHGDCVHTLGRVCWNTPNICLVRDGQGLNQEIVPVGSINVEPQVHGAVVVMRVDFNYDCDLFAWHVPAAIQGDSDHGIRLRQGKQDD